MHRSYSPGTGVPRAIALASPPPRSVTGSCRRSPEAAGDQHGVGTLDGGIARPHDCMSKVRRVLIFCPLHEGGIAEHAHYQANALAGAGIDTQMLVSPGFLPDHARKGYRTLPWLFPVYASRGGRLRKAIHFVFATIANEAILAFRTLFWGHRHVFLAASSETLALAWAWPHLLLRLAGVRYATNIHDPQRKRLSGSSLVHRWSIRAGFLPIRTGLIHEDFDTNQPDIPRHVHCLRVPYGCYEADIRPGDGATLRAELAPEGSGRRIFLAFGYIADRKNLDLCIRAVAQVPRAVLLAAGRVASRHDKPVDYYRALAAELGCADRVRIDDGFIPEDQVRHYFGAADAILLSYKAEFVSQSGVLLLASNWGKPVLA
jgi:glycosyltransferase involved in cell wall biosynthesis